MLNLWEAAKTRATGGPSFQQSGTSYGEPSLEAAGAVPLRVAAGAAKRSTSYDGLAAGSQQTLKRRKTRAKHQGPAKDSMDISTVLHESVVSYEAPSNGYQQLLLDELKANGLDRTLPRALSRHVLEVAHELGQYAADWTYRKAIEELSHSQEDPAMSPVFRTTESWPRALPVTDLSSSYCNVTPHLSTLLGVLSAGEVLGDEFRAIILVQRRSVASALSEILGKVGETSSTFRPTMVAACKSRPGSYREVFKKFTQGTYNVLVITRSVVDLGIPQATLIVQFNPFRDPLSYSYLRLIARQGVGHLVHLVETGNELDHATLEALQHTDQDSWIAGLDTELVIDSPPPHTFLGQHDAYDSDDSDDEDSSEYVQDPVTGARIYPSDATLAVCQLGSSPDRILAQPLFTAEGRAGGWQYTVHLPEDCGVGLLSGDVCRDRALARRNACFLTCATLLRGRQLPSNVFPLRISTTLPHETNCLENAKKHMSGTDNYPRKQPDFWRFCLSTASLDLFPTVVSLSDVSHSRQAILCRQPLPALDDVLLFRYGVQVPVEVVNRPRFTPTGQQLSLLHHYTLRLLRCTNNQAYACSQEDMPYFLAPLNDDLALNSGTNLLDSIRWDDMSRANEHWTTSLNVRTAQALADDIQNVIIQDKVGEFSRRYEVEHVRTDMSPLSKPPPDCVREAAHTNFLEHCRVVSSRSAQRVTNHEQPLLQVTKIHDNPNHLNPLLAPPEKKAGETKYLIPEICYKLTVPATVFKTTLLIPSLMRRVDEILLAKEANFKLLRHLVNERHLLMALTPESAMAEFNYERLEFLGDAFLKYVVSLHVYLTNPDANEGTLHNLRQNIISNNFLRECALRLGLPSFIQGSAFSAKHWRPPGYSIVGQADDMTRGRRPPTATPGSVKTGSKKQAADDVQTLGHKAIADVVEAIIGGAYLTGGIDSAIQAAKCIGVPLTGIHRWSDFQRLHRERVAGNPQTPPTAILSSLESITGYRFRRYDLLAEALKNGCHVRERLEFLGDAVLDFVLARYLFHKYAYFSPGGLTEMKNAATNNGTLAAICVVSGLSDHLDSSPRTNEFKKTIFQRQQDHNGSNFWHDLAPPKTLSDGVEALIGAVFVSEEFSIDGVETIFKHMVLPFCERNIVPERLAQHPKMTLSDLLHRRGCHNFEFQKGGRNEEAGTCHAQVIVHGARLALGEADSSFGAERNAAMRALDALKDDTDFLARTCDCRSSARARKRGKAKTGPVDASEG